MRYIDDTAFSSCACLQNVVIPEGVEYIGSYAFEDCLHLKRVVLPTTLRRMGKRVFWGCDELEEVVFQSHIDYKERAPIFDHNSQVRTSFQ